jgi:predicted DNA-binding transcriptional regulator YafY
MSELRQLLLQYPRGVTVTEIAAHLDVTTRSARRYLDEIRVDLEAVPERPGGEKRWRIPSVDMPRRVALRRTQAYALLAAKPLFDQLRGSTLYEEIQLASETLIGVARRPGRGPNGGVAEGTLEQRFRYVPFAPIRYDARAEELDALFEAVADLRPLACRYPRASDGELERLLVHPLALLLYKEAIQCLALDASSGGRGEVRALALERIRDAHTLADERFEVPADFDLADYLQGQFGIWRAEGAPIEILIDFDATVADHVLARTVHASQQVFSSERGVRLRLELTDLTEVTAWVLGFGSRAEVVSPPELREAVKAELQKTLQRY